MLNLKGTKVLNFNSIPPYSNVSLFPGECLGCPKTSTMGFLAEKWFFSMLSTFLWQKKCNFWGIFTLNLSGFSLELMQK